MRPIVQFLREPKEILSSILKKYGKYIPDNLYLRWQYRLQMGVKLNLRNPVTFTEKIQWLKLYDRKPEYIDMVDKLAVKEYVGNLIGKEYIIPTIGTWDSIENIDWDKLPNQFVLKTTHGGGGTGVVVVKDKSMIDRSLIKKQLNWSLNDNGFTRNREWPYKGVPRKVFAEKLIEINGKQDLTDYKLYCFNGEPKYIQVIQDRNTRETIDFYDVKWVHQPFYGLNPKASQAKSEVPRPIYLESMLKIARILAKNTFFVRVDLYYTEKGILFGEITFYPSSGIGRFTPEEWNKRLGELIQLPN